ncbi:hypothetical protein vseg_021613 [Gypsophila vaccaria]
MGVQEKIRGHMEKFVVLPFSMGCVCHASVAVAEHRPKTPKLYLQSPASRNKEDGEDKDEERFLRPILSTGVNRLVKSFKSLSQLFIYEDEMEELDMDMEMEIGSPTDVKHVAHIGLDSLGKTNPIMGWKDMDITPAFITHPIPVALTLKHF